METELTKRIKELTHGYKPQLPTKMRTIRWADEVWTPSGIVDSIRFEDFYTHDTWLCPLLHPDSFPQKQVEWSRSMVGRTEDDTKLSCKDGSTTQTGEACRGCVFLHRVHEIGMMITCYEVKITLSDFKSPHGHNFHGNENYYCVPKELAPQIVDDIPDHVGILCYYKGPKGDGLRMYKPALWQDVQEETKTMLLYNALKKWCDGAVFRNREEEY